MPDAHVPDGTSVWQQSVAADPDVDTAVAAGPRRWLLLAAPLVLYLVVRGLGLLVLEWLKVTNGGKIDLHQWDGSWYLAIAEHGYLGLDSGMLDAFGRHTAYSGMVFFPGYPQAVRVMALLFAHNFLFSGIFVSIVGGVAAAYAIARLTHRMTGSHVAGLLAVVLFAAAPMSIVYSMAYPEALLGGLVAWTFVGLLERRWLMTTVCVAAAGYVSPMAAPLIGVVILAAFVDIFKGRVRWEGLATIVLAPVGMIGYLLWVAVKTGNASGYFAVQKAGWGSGFDGGLTSLQWIEHTWATDSSAFTVLTGWFVVAVVVLLVLGFRRMPWQLWLFSLGAVLLAVGSSGIVWDKVRLLLVAFPLLIPVAAALARKRPLAIGVVTIVLTFAGLWFSAYSLAVWHSSI